MSRQGWEGRPGFGRMGHFRQDPGFGYGDVPGWGPGMAPGSGRQFRGMRMMDNIPGLTDKQKKELADLRDQQMQEISKFREENQAKMKSMMEEHHKKVMSVLTDEQKKYLEKGMPHDSLPGR